MKFSYTHPCCLHTLIIYLFHGTGIRGKLTVQANLVRLTYLHSLKHFLNAEHGDLRAWILLDVIHLDHLLLFLNLSLADLLEAAC